MSSIRSKIFLVLIGRVFHTVQDVLTPWSCLPYGPRCSYFLVVSSIRSKMFLVLISRVFHTVQDFLSSYWSCLPYGPRCSYSLVVSSIRSKMFLVLISRVFHMTECFFLFVRPILHSDSTLVFYLSYVQYGCIFCISSHFHTIWNLESRSYGSKDF